MLEYQGFLIIAAILWVHKKNRTAIAALAIAVIVILVNPTFQESVRQGYAPAYNHARGIN